MKIKQLIIGVFAISIAILSFDVAAVHATEGDNVNMAAAPQSSASATPIPTPPIQIIIPENYITVSGVVKNRSGEPVEDVWIGFNEERDAELGYFGTVRTDENGRYETMFPAGTYWMHFLHGDSWYAPIEPVQIVISGEMTIDKVLFKSSSFSGTATIADRLPVPSQIRFHLLQYTMGDANMYWKEIDVYDSYTNTFAWQLNESVASGTYRICASADTEGEEPYQLFQCYGSPYLEDATDITIGDEETLDGFNIAFTDHYNRLTVTAVDDRGEPVQGAEVALSVITATDENVPQYEFVRTTDENGRIEHPIVNGEYRATITPGSDRYAEQERVRFSVDGDANLNITLQTQYGITGAFTTSHGTADDIQPHEVSIQLYEWDDSQSEWTSIAWNHSYEESGNYSINDIEPGTYRVCAIAFDVVLNMTPRVCYGGGDDPADGADVIMGNGIDATGIDLYIDTSDIIRGRGTVIVIVTDEQGNPLEGIPVQSGLVTDLFLPPPWPFPTNYIHQYGTTGADGLFELTAFANARYHFTFNDSFSGPTWYYDDTNPQYVGEKYADIPIYNGTPASDERTAVEVSVGETVTITAALADISVLSTIMGQITFENVESVGSNYVHLLRLDESTGEYNRIYGVGTIYIASDGTYTIPDVGAGTYHLCYQLSINNSPRTSECYGSTVAEEAADVVIGLGETITLSSTIDGSPTPLAITFNRLQDMTVPTTPTIIMIVTSALLISGTIVVFWAGRGEE